MERRFFQALYEFIIRLIPPYFYEADIWFRIIRKLGYTKVIVIHSPDEESRMVTERFQMLTDDSEIQVQSFHPSSEKIIILFHLKIERLEEYAFDANLTTLVSKLTAEDRLLARVFIIHTRFVISSMNKERNVVFNCYRMADADELLSAIVRLNKLDNFVWILNERVLRSNSPALFDG